MIKNYFTYLKFWLFVVIFLSLLVYASITWLHFNQKKELTQKIVVLENIKHARIDLAKGFLHIGLANKSESPFKKEIGLAFINQSIVSFRNSLNLDNINVFNDTERKQIYNFSITISNFQKALEEWNSSGSNNSKLEANLRITFYNLEQQADEIDRVLRVELLKTSSENHKNIFYSILLSVILLIIICSIVLYLVIISNKKNLELLKNKEQLDLVADNLVNGMIYQVAMLDQNKRQFNYLSEAVNKLYGCSVEEGIENSDLIYGRVHKDDIANLIKIEKEALAQMKTFKAEARVINPDKSIRWSYYVSQPRIINGMVCWDGFEVDITEQKQMEIDLLNSIEKEEVKTIQLQAMFDAIPDLIFRINNKGIILDYKADIQDLYYQKGSINGKKHSDILPSYFVKQLDENIKKTLESDQTQTFEYFLEVPNIGQRKYEARMSKSGKNEVTILVRDITEKYTAEKLLNEGQKQLTNILESMNEAFVALDENYCYTYINEKAGVLLNRKPAELIGKNIWVEFPFAFGKSFELNYQKVMKEKVSIRMEEYFPPLDIWFESSINSTKNGVAMFFSDISERKKNEVALLEAKEKAEESDRLKSAFLANMSHEIRTPMNGILGFSNLLSEPNLDEKEKQEYIKLIQKSGARMLNLITEIIDISKIESGLMVVKQSNVNINEQMDFAFELLKIDAKEKSLQLSHHNSLPFSEAFIKTDHEKLYAVITNLIKNAIKYSDEGAIHFGYSVKGENIEFFVKDTGIGIAKERQESIFDRFVQVDIDNIQARQGAGLGLAISKALVRLLEGEIWVESELEKGSTFYFTIPYKRIEEDKKELQNNIATTNTEELKQNIPLLKILIADDDSISRMLLSKTVKEIASETIEVKSGKEALESLKNNPDTNIVLMDIQMPEMNGYEATRQIRKFNKDIVIIAQSAFGINGDKVKAMEVGCTDYISKPINKNDLMTLIHKYF